MDFNNLYYFYLVAEHGGYTAAQNVSGLTKSLLSRRITQLEDQLDARLIQRNTHQFALTSTGKLLHERSAQMVREGVLAYESVSEVSSEPMGPIRVCCPTVLAQYHLAPIIPEFMKLYPKVIVNIDATDRPVDIIEEMFDLVLRSRANVDDVPGLIAKTIARSQPILVASPEVIQQYGMPKSPYDLQKVPTISSVMDRHEGEQIWHVTSSQGDMAEIKHTPVLFCLNPKVQHEAVVQGVGFGLIPEALAAKDLNSGGLVRVLEEWSTEAHLIHILFQSRKHMNPAVRAFLDYLSEKLPLSLNK
ncbi:LysR family transcriptional regulator [Vibrio sp.]|nr:LysR family transcriptional regulator [Vibrio sp.]